MQLNQFNKYPQNNTTTIQQNFDNPGTLSPTNKKKFHGNYYNFDNDIDE